MSALRARVAAPDPAAHWVLAHRYRQWLDRPRPGFFGRDVPALMGEALWEEGRASNQFLRTPEEMWGALWRTVDLVRELASGLARDLGVVYPASLDETMTSCLRSLQRLARA